MSTNLLSDAIETLETARSSIDRLESEITMWRDRAENAEKLLGFTDSMSLVGKIEKAAAQDGIPVKDWILQKLADAVAPKAMLPVDHDVYNVLLNLAHAKNHSLYEFTTGEEFTQALMSMIDNRMI